MTQPARARLDLATLRAVPGGVWALGIVSLLMDASSEMIHALLPVYLVTVMGASTLTVGIIEGIAEATAATVKIFSGAISDRIGKRKLLAVIGYGLAALTKPLFPLAPAIGWLVAARFIDRVGKGIRDAPRDALLADISPAHLRGAAFGLRQSLDTVGALVGPLLAILLMWLFAGDISAVFWCAVLPAFLALAFMIFGVPEPQRPAGRRTVKSPLSRGELGRLGVGYWAVVALAVVFTLARFSEAFLLLKAQASGLPAMLVPAVMVVMNLVYAAAAYPAGVLSDSGDRMRVLLAGLALLVGADLVLALASGVPGVMIGVALWGLHMGLTQGLLSALVADRAPAELRGTAFGVYNLLTGLALLAASIIAGAVWAWIGPQATFLMGAAFTAVSLLGFLALASGTPPTGEAAG
ncbi:MAG: MFS transporter [Alphaproteobacteria bacterium]|nr:MFS transporter [Alphaproteobacteria bacterium]